jgi:hypothetical protein
MGTSQPSPFKFNPKRAVLSSERNPAPHEYFALNFLALGSPAKVLTKSLKSVKPIP